MATPRMFPENEFDWRPASGHRSGWRVVRSRPNGHGCLEELSDKRGRRRLFRSIEGAWRAIDKLKKESRGND